MRRVQPLAAPAGRQTTPPHIGASASQQGLCSHQRGLLPPRWGWSSPPRAVPRAHALGYILSPASRAGACRQHGAWRRLWVGLTRAEGRQHVARFAGWCMASTRCVPTVVVGPHTDARQAACRPLRGLVRGVNTGRSGGWSVAHAGARAPSESVCKEKVERLRTRTCGAASRQNAFVAQQLRHRPTP